MKLASFASQVDSKLGSWKIQRGIASWLVATGVMASLMISGCCGPIGPGCHSGHCHDCDGTAGRPIPYAPFSNLKRQLICGGGGCGEVYVGEWISTPPDCEDPCCGDQFVGGAYPARPFCWQPGSLLDWRRFSGRFEDGGGCCDGGCQSSGDCGCGGETTYSDDGNAGPILEHRSSPGCATCSQGNAMTNSRSGSGTQWAESRSTGHAPANSTRMAQAQRTSESSTRTTRTAGSATRIASNQPRPAASNQARPANSAQRTGQSRNRVVDYQEHYVEQIQR